MSFPFLKEKCRANFSTDFKYIKSIALIKLLYNYNDLTGCLLTYQCFYNALITAYYFLPNYNFSRVDQFSMKLFFRVRHKSIKNFGFSMPFQQQFKLKR